MNLAKKVINKIRHKFKREEKPRTLLEIALAKQAAEMYSQEFWEREKKIVRDKNFQKAQIARKKQLEQLQIAKEAEEKRQEKIYKQRLKNLKKARNG